MSTLRLTNRDNLPVSLAAVAGIIGTASLLACGLLHYDPVGESIPLRVFVFVLCLATLTISTIILFRRARYRSAVAIFVVAVTLYCFSEFKLYGKHWTPWSDEPHHHTLWELGHVH